MAARDNVSPAQFMSAREITGSYQPWHRESFGDESTEEMWSRKLDEAHSMGNADEEGQNWRSLHTQIAEEGVKVPVVLGSRTGKIHSGHHRIAVMNDVRPDDPIPVVHVKAKDLPGTHREMERRGMKY